MYGVSDQAGRGMRRVDRMRRGPPDQSKHTWRFKVVITVVMVRRGSHLSRLIVIQGAISEAFYNDHLRGTVHAVHRDWTTTT